MKDSISLLAACLVFATASAFAQTTPAGPVGLTLKTIIQAETTMIGQPIRFPQTDGQITAVLAEVAPADKWAATCIRCRCLCTSSKVH